MKKSLLLFTLILIFSIHSVSIAQTAEPDANGDYRGASCQLYWKVVDPDINGLNGRLSYDFPLNWDNINWKCPKVMNIGEWPVIIVFRLGMILNACQGNRGIMLIDDERGLPWLMVEISSDEICFVRANEKYIKPVYVSE